MGEIESQLASLRQQADQARQRRDSAEHQQQVAQETVARVRQDLAAEFGVQTVEEAQALLAQLQENAQQEIMNVQAALAAAQGGPQ